MLSGLLIASCMPASDISCLTDAKLQLPLEPQLAKFSCPVGNGKRMEECLLEAWPRFGAPYAGFNGSLLVAKDGQVLLEQGFGIAHYNHLEPANSILNSKNTVFRMGSSTKTFTSMAILLVQQEVQAQGRTFELDDRVSQHLAPGEFDRYFVSCDSLANNADDAYCWPSEFKAALTIRHLLNHTSGLKRMPFNQFTELCKSVTPVDGKPPVFSIDQLLNPLDNSFSPTNMKPLFKPGSDYSYSNTGFIVLGEIVAYESGISFGQFVQERIFNPLGMLNTTYDELDEIDAPNRATSYLNRYRLPIPWLPLQYNNARFDTVGAVSSSMARAAGSIFSTVGDYHLWARAILDGTFFPWLEFQAIALSPGPHAVSKQLEYGLGWMLETHKFGKRNFWGNWSGGELVYSHDGSIDSFFISTINIYPEHDLILVAASNVGNVHAARSMIDALAKKVLYDTIY